MNSTARALVLLSFAVACSNDDDAPSVQDRCEMLFDAICEELSDCVDGLQHAECIDYQHSIADCSTARSVEDSYDECIEHLYDISCRVLIDSDGDLRLPASCVGVLND